MKRAFCPIVGLLFGGAHAIASPSTGGGGIPTDVTLPDEFPRFVVSGDLDGDHDDDLITSTGMGGISVFLNDGAGRFGAGTAFDAGGVTTAVLALGDWDGDGDLDLVASDDGGNQLITLLNDGVGAFAFDGSLPLGGSEFRSLVAGDIDGDGDDDVVAGANQLVSVFVNDGTGAFGVVEYDPGGTLRAIALADVDGDIDLDLIVARNFQTILVRPNDGAGSFGPGVASGPSMRPTRLTVGDVDGDGDLDAVLIVASGPARELRLLRNAGDGTFADAGADPRPGGRRRPRARGSRWRLGPPMSS